MIFLTPQKMRRRRIRTFRGGLTATMFRPMLGRGRFVGRRRARREFRRGFDRTGGFFGRFRGRRAFRGNRGPELKFIDTDVDQAAIAVTGTVLNSVNLIAQGTTESQRIGRKCVVRSINWRMNILLPNAANLTSTNDEVRIILFLDKQTNGAAATVTGILESANYQSFNNLSNKSRFRTLMDRVYAMNAMAGAGDGTANDAAGVVMHDTLFKRVNIPLEFDSTAGAITELRSNNIGVLLISKSARCTLDSKIRLRFSDV